MARWLTMLPYDSLAFRIVGRDYLQVMSVKIATMLALLSNVACDCSGNATADCFNSSTPEVASVAEEPVLPGIVRSLSLPLPPSAYRVASTGQGDRPRDS